tara:strand:- start:3843 stop:4865 length:1023 start_codon:yes stop_codon:yes gene_type:complete
MANLISVSVLRYGEREFGTTLAEAKTMMLSSEHIIYGTNVETLMSVTLTGGVGASNTFTFSGQTGLTAGEYVRVGNVGDGVATMDVLSADLVAGTIFKVKDINGGSNPTMQTDEAGTTATVQNDESGLALKSYLVQGEIIYADPAQGGAPIKLRIVEPCVNVADGFGVSAKSGQLRAVEVNKKNGVAYDAVTISEVNLLVNLDRVILTYEGGSLGASVDDWMVFYDASNTNFAGLDSPFVDILEVETSLDGLQTSFVQHMGGKTAVSDFASLTVNGRVVAFPDTSLSGFVRLKNICSGFDNASSKAQILIKGSGKIGFDTLALDEAISTAVASTESNLTT